MLRLAQLRAHRGLSGSVWRLEALSVTELDHQLGRLGVDQRPVTAGQVEQQHADHSAIMTQQPTGVFLAPEECRQLLWSAIRDLDRQQRDDGGASPAPGYMALLRKLQAAAVARATPSAKVAAEPRQLTTAEAASVMGVSPQRVRQLAADGKIIARKAGRDWQVSERSAGEWRNRRGNR